MTKIEPVETLYIPQNPARGENVTITSFCEILVSEKPIEGGEQIKIFGKTYYYKNANDKKKKSTT